MQKSIKRSQTMRIALKMCLSLLVLLGITIAVYRFRGGYSLKKITSHLSESVQCTPKDIEKFMEIKNVLDQPFYFLGSGGTSFAFLGKDGKTVLKFFKHQHLSKPCFLFC